MSLSFPPLLDGEQKGQPLHTIFSRPGKENLTNEEICVEKTTSNVCYFRPQKLGLKCDCSDPIWDEAKEKTRGRDNFW